ncbi:histidinol dehydrogenase [Buchnera aphidicola (Hormaphis cornu)]|nr:histidinol dehydrogenase [Buchnera aphidicola (Hormaphis cornu)]
MCINVVYWSKIDFREQKRVLSRPCLRKKKFIKQVVEDILKEVKKTGDKALFKYTSKFDKVKIDSFKVTEEIISNAKRGVSKKLKRAIQIAKKNIEVFHNAQKTSQLDVQIQSGIRCSQMVSPINSIGIYIPGGSAPLISTVLMLAIPANIAGCRKIVLCSPPKINNAILYAANQCNISDIYQVGGAQAIAALSFGTQSIPKVNKIFGPGNAYVTEAKLQVSNLLNATSIDMIAGPSELMIIAGEESHANFIAADLISQAEHGIDSQVFLVTPSINLAKAVEKSLLLQINKAIRSDIIKESLKNSSIIITKDLIECTKISNLYAPEHLIIQINSAKSLLRYIINAGSIFLGHWSPESVGDYASGSNHVLPTYGYSSSQSGLSLKDFQKYITVQELTAKGLIDISESVESLADAEALDGHKNAVRIRVDYIKEKLLC